MYLKRSLGIAFIFLWVFLIFSQANSINKTRASAHEEGTSPVVMQTDPTPTRPADLQPPGEPVPALPPAWPVSASTMGEETRGSDLDIPPLLQPVTMLRQPASTEFAISTLPSTSEEAPSIDGSKVVWFDDRTNGPTDVWGYDLTTDQQFQVTNHPAAQLIADISGDVVVYEDNRNGTWDIYGKHLSTGQEFVVATGPHHQRYPRVWGDYVVYQDETSDYFQSDVYLYRISTGVTTPLAVAQSYQGRPDIDNGWIVWTDWRSGAWQLGIYRIATGTYTFRPVDCDDGCQPRVFGNEVVWNGWRAGRYDIYLYNLSTGVESTVFAEPGDQRFPSISDTLIVWQDETAYGNWDVFVYVRATGTIFPVTLEPSRQQQATVYGNTVVWQDNRNHTWDIYGLTWDGTIPPGTSPALPNPRNLHVGAYPDGEIRLAWTDNVPDEQGFVIQRATGIFSTDWSDWVTLPANTTSYVDTNTTLRESYWYRVRAYNANGSSSYSNESYATAFDYVPNLDERYMHVLINEARMAPGVWGYPGLTPVNPLGWNANLAYSARTHALGMNNSSCCQGHVDLAGRGPSERANDSGYPYGTGENLFQATSGRQGMESAHQGFMNSEGHRDNIMAADLKQTAIGFAPGGRGTLVEVFSGGPAGTVVPALPSGTVVPYNGTVSTIFDFLVSFWNPGQQAPVSAVVVIDGVSHPMSLRNGSPGRGTYIYSTALALGNHTYYFEFRWGNPQQTARLPETGEFDGPHVRPLMPNLVISNPFGNSMVAGYATPLYAWVENAGEISAASVIARFYVGDPQAGGAIIGTSNVIGQLDPGQSQRVQVSWMPSSPGTYSIYAWVDPENTVQESNESDNTAFRNLSVREANLTWFVDGSVASSGNGQTPESPFKTIAEALNHYAYPGDTVVVAAGVYHERFTVPSGVRLLGNGSEQTMVNGSGSPGAVVHLNPGSAIEGFTITGSGPEYFDAGIWHSDGEVHILDNRIAGNGVGIMTWCWNPGCAAIANIRNNVFVNNSRAADANNEGIHRITNNTVVGNGRGIVMNNASSVAENNIVAQNTGDGIAGNGWNPTVRYNVVWGNGQDYSGASPGVGSISADPMLRNWEGGDFRLHAGSPAVGRGLPPNTDIGALPFMPTGNAPDEIAVARTGPQEWTLSWAGTGAVGYNVYLGSQARLYTQRFDAQDATTFTLRDLVPGMYYLAVSSYDEAGHESPVSSEISLDAQAIPSPTATPTSSSNNWRYIPLVLRH